MTSKSQSDFAAVFAYIREFYGAYISPNVVMANFDPNMQQALAFTFPEATIKGFWFHYTDVSGSPAKSYAMHTQWTKFSKRYNV